MTAFLNNHFVQVIYRLMGFLGTVSVETADTPLDTAKKG